MRVFNCCGIKCPRLDVVRVDLHEPLIVDARCFIFAFQSPALRQQHKLITISFERKLHGMGEVMCAAHQHVQITR